jgi:hypothetical protein
MTFTIPDLAPGRDRPARKNSGTSLHSRNIAGAAAGDRSSTFNVRSAGPGEYG